MSVIIEQLQDEVYTITLNKPEKKNALNTDLLSALYYALRNAEEKKSPVVVIRGSGGAFSAGGILANSGTWRIRR